MDYGAFWSYAHWDDNDDGQRISALADHLAKRIRMRTGEPFHIFHDRTNLLWGDEWAQKLEEALLGTSFFIPIVTPTYIKSEYCRYELLKFSSAAGALGLDELILPILYVRVPELETGDESNDEVITTIKRFQWYDFSETALEDPGYSRFRKAIDHLASQIIERSEIANAKPTPNISVGRRSGGSGEPGAPSAEGASPKPSSGDGSEGASQAISEPAEAEDEAWLEVLAKGEQAVPDLVAVLNEIAPVIGEIGEAMQASNQQLAKSDQSGKGFAGRLTVARELAKTLGGPASSLERLVPTFLSRLTEVDQMVLVLFGVLRSDPTQRASAEEFLQVISTVATGSIEGLTSGEGFTEGLKEIKRISKDLRKPVSRIETSMRQMTDARSIFQSWLTQLEALPPS